MTRFLTLSALLLAAPLAGCGGSDESFDGQIEDTGEPGMLGRAQEMTSAFEKMEQAAQQPPADPVDFRRLRDLLPESLDGLERTEIEGATQGTMGFSVSEAEAVYQAPDDSQSRIEIKVTDMGAVPAMGMMGLGWTMTDVDRETTTGYEKTIQFGGHRGFRKYDTESERGEFSLLVADRFAVVVDGRNVTDAQLEQALRAVDLSALAAMRDEGRQQPQS